MQIQDVMSTNVAAVTTEDSVDVAARLLSRRNIGVLPVTGADGTLRGILTDRDIVLRCVAASKDPGRTKVCQIMTANPIALRPDDDANEAAAMMAARQIRRLPITENGRLVGMLSLGDLAVQPDYSMEAAECLADICSNLKI